VSALAAAASTDEFWERIGQTPLIGTLSAAGESAAGLGDPPRIVEFPGTGASSQHTLLTFLWRDADAHAVLISLNRINRSLEDSLMQRIEGTDIWYRTFEVGAHWRGSYTVLAVDGAELEELRSCEPRWVMRRIRERGATDPRNPLVTGTHGGRASVAQVPGAPWEPVRAAAHTVRGTTSEHRLPSGRRVWLHRPAGVSPECRLARPLVVLLDGEVWHRTGYGAETIDELCARGEFTDSHLAPFLLLVDCEGEPRRMQDLSIDGGMCDELVTEILPWLRERVPLSPNPSDVVISGESLGGLTALKTVLLHPEHFGAAIAQSPSLWQSGLGEPLAHASPARVFMTAGVHEQGLVEHVRVCSEALTDRDYTHRYIEFNGGHDFAWWHGLWAEGVRHLLTSSTERSARW